MDMVRQAGLARRLMKHAQDGTTDLAPYPMIVTVDSYRDEQRWAAEVEQFYRRLPIVACLSCELPEPNSHLAMTIVDVPILLTRDAEGEINAFLNICSHRGARLVSEQECAAKVGRFSCPYHSWTYDSGGKLIGIPDAGLFGDVDRAQYGLTRLQADERAGMVFVILTAGIEVDIDDYLSGIDTHMGDDGAQMHFAGSRNIRGGNWKLLVDGHLEAYHFSTLHRDSIAAFMVNGCTANEKFGPHQLITFCANSIHALADVPEEQWRPIDDDQIQPQYHFFPGTLVTLFKGAMLVQMIRPAGSVGQSTSRIAFAQSDGSDDPPRLEEVVRLVETEDYSVSYDIFAGMQAAPRNHILLGRNESCVQHFHKVLDERFEPAE